MSEEAEVFLEQKRLQEEEVWNILEQHMRSWEPWLAEESGWTKDNEDMVRAWKEKEGEDAIQRMKDACSSQI